MSFINSLRICSYCCVLMALLSLPHAAGKISFNSKYNGKTVTGLVGSSVNFTWSFSGDVDTVDWGLKKDGVNGFVNNGRLVSLDKSGSVSVTVPSAYSGRVSGSGDVSSGQAIFTLSSIRKSDDRYFGCRISPTDSFMSQKFDLVYLAVKEAPQISISSVQASYNEGSSVNISCIASGTPDPDVKWMKNGRVESSGKNAALLMFRSINRADDGQYTCKANNSAGQYENHMTLVVYYPPTIKKATTSAVKSWIGQTVTLKCVSDGVPTPTLSWYTPDGSQIKIVTATQNTVNVKMEVDQDFGGYKCDADNGLTPADYKIVKIEQIKKPGSPAIVSSASEIQATSLTVKWTATADDGGSPITAYRVVILKGDTEIKNENVTDPSTTSLSVGGLERDTEYIVKVFARNAVFEGPAAEKAVETKYEGVPAAATIDDLPSEVTDDTITLKWSEPQNNGKVITHYTVYQRIVTDGKPGEWTELKTITATSVRELKVELEKGKVYEFVVTATNEFGESLKEGGKIKRVKASEKGGGDIQSGGAGEDNGKGAAIYAGAAAAVVVLIVGIIVIIILWRRRKPANHGATSTGELGSVYSNVLEDGHRSLSREAAQSLQASGPAAEPTYANVGQSKKKRKNRKPPTDKYGQNAQASAAEPDQSFTMVPSGASTNYAVPSSGMYMPLHPSGRSWEIKREQVKVIKVIGKGAFSQVAKATAWDIRGNGEYTTVAAKMLKVNAPESDRKDLLSELELMKRLKPHPHVIKLVACVTETDPLLVLIEYVPFGDLLGYLRKSRGLNDTYFKDPDVKPQTTLTAEQLMKFAWQVADGMCYLSSRKIIHRDLAARNVLVGEGEKCKVTDFGMARNVHQDDIYTKRSRGRLPAKWTAYEALLYGTYTTQSDVWSYGVLLYEILTVGGSPYPGIKAREIARKLQEGFRMPKPKHVDSKLYQIMLNCWEKNPSDRPTFAKLKETMKDMDRNHRTYVNLKQYDNSLYANIEDLTAV
ncbi:uncharacterized protein LOC144662658 [Oculina patagonica]